MGGRASMKAALLYPERVNAVMALDAPATSFAHMKKYVGGTYALAKFFYDLEIEKFSSLEEVEVHMKETINPNEAALTRIMRNFYITNENQIAWKPNPKYLIDNLESMYYFEHIGEFYGPAKMLVGGISNRWTHEHFTDCFPNIKKEDVIAVKEAGHWVHTDSPESVITHLEDLLQRVEHGVKE